VTPRAPVDPLPHATARLMLRRFAAADLRSFQAYRSDPAVGRYQGWSAMDDAAAAAFIAAMAAAPFGVPGEWFQLAVAERPTGVLVGDIGLILVRERPGVAEIGFSMAPAVQRRGYGTEAVRAALALLFASARVESVEGVTDARNAASIRLLERVGMRRVRTQQAQFRGEPCTEFVYDLARAQWRPAAAADYQ
jgi:[ribosomal protein S5]-alanine N-acetyltransferase